MSIINAFDDQSKAMIDLSAFMEPKDFGEVCIVTFSVQVKEMFLKEYPHEIVSGTKTANGVIDIYRFEIQGKKILFYMSPICSAAAACTMHEVHYFSGADKFIVFGSCGILDNEKCAGRLIIPTAAYRDEGLSYHYMEPSDYVDIKNAKKIAAVFDRLKYPYVAGKTWTTDGIYMETVNKANARRKEGCLTVEMEAAGLQAICNYYGYEFYPFFFGADVFESDSWDRADLGNEQEFNSQKESFKVALELALSL